MYNFDYEAEERRAAVMGQSLIAAGVNVIKMVHTIDEYYKDRLLPPSPPVACDDETCTCSSSLREDLIAENEALQADNAQLEAALNLAEIKVGAIRELQNEIYALKTALQRNPYGGGSAMTNSYQGGCTAVQGGCGGGGGNTEFVEEKSNGCGDLLYVPPEYCDECGQTPDTCTCEDEKEPQEQCPRCGLWYCMCEPKSNQCPVCTIYRCGCGDSAKINPSGFCEKCNLPVVCLCESEQHICFTCGTEFIYGRCPNCAE